MAKLYPPYIEGTLPAFCLDDSGDGTITIPFAHNRAVTKNEVVKFVLKFKTIQNDVLLGDIIVSSWDKTNNCINLRVKDGKIKFTNSSTLEFKIGQYYKVQVAYIDTNETIGYYSTVGVIKCTSKPEVTIAGLSDTSANGNQVEYVGLFKQAENGDVTEKVYSSRFLISKIDGTEVLNTEEAIHSVENDPSSYESQDTLKFYRDLEYGEIYTIKYIVTTTNGLVISSPSYVIVQQRTVDPSIEGDLIAELEREDGYISVSIKGYVDEETGEELVSGAFVLSRRDSLDPNGWEKMTTFTLTHEYPTKEIFKDFTIEQGKTYTYSIQQYNDKGVYSNRKLSNDVFSEFDDMFLFDGKRQLKLKFNPQVSNFKTQLAETRSETIGSKYPFFFRNARVGYKVFPVSGLISMLSDDNEFFTTYEDISRDRDLEHRGSTLSSQEWFKNIKYSFIDNHDDDEGDELDTSGIQWEIIRREDFDWKSHNPFRNLVDKNFVSERVFKLMVLDWLNDGRVKLFKSPGEGNYLVRMMDTSLSPNATVGRMLHNVNSTAYECAELNYDNLIKYNIVEDNELSPTDAYVTNWRQVRVNNETEIVASSDGSYHTVNLFVSDSAYSYTTSLRFTDFLPGDKIQLVFNSDRAYVIDPDPGEALMITVGSTGAYYLEDVQPVYGIYLTTSNSDNAMELNNLSSRSVEPLILYEYRVPAKTGFNSIDSVDTEIGAYLNVVGPAGKIIENKMTSEKETVTKICFGDFFLRPVEYLYYYEDNFEATTNSSCFGSFIRETIDGTAFSNINRNWLLSQNLYWDLVAGGGSDLFNYKDSMEYSPYSLYVIRNAGDVVTHAAGAYSTVDNTNDTHSDSHINEQEYIDRIYNSTSAQDFLTNYSLTYIASKEEGNEALKTYIEDNPLYVLDPWNNKIYRVGKFKNSGDTNTEWFYNPTISIDGEEIDLREILNYSISAYESNELPVLTLRNGVYGIVFYHKVIFNYSFESEVEGRNPWITACNNVKNAKVGFYEEARERSTFATYNTNLKKAKEQWVEPEESEG